MSNFRWQNIFIKAIEIGRLLLKIKYLIVSVSESICMGTSRYLPFLFILMHFWFAISWWKKIKKFSYIFLLTTKSSYFCEKNMFKWDSLLSLWKLISSFQHEFSPTYKGLIEKKCDKLSTFFILIRHGLDQRSDSIQCNTALIRGWFEHEQFEDSTDQSMHYGLFLVHVCCFWPIFDLFRPA